MYTEDQSLFIWKIDILTSVFNKLILKKKKNVLPWISKGYVFPYVFILEDVMVSSVQRKRMRSSRIIVTSLASPNRDVHINVLRVD